MYVVVQSGRDVTMAPFVEYDMEETYIKWSKYYPDCDYLSFKVDSSFINTLNFYKPLIAKKNQQSV